MKQWGIGFNDYFHTSSIILEEGSMWLYLVDRVISFICYCIPSIKPPKIKFRLKNKDDWDVTENNDGYTDLQEWYGDISQVWHIFVCMPWCTFMYKRIKTEMIDMPFDEMVRRFPQEAALCMENGNLEQQEKE